MSANAIEPTSEAEMRRLMHDMQTPRDVRDLAETALFLLLRVRTATWLLRRLSALPMSEMVENELRLFLEESRRPPC